MVITKEKGCAAISTMVAQPFSCKASIGIGTNPMPVSFASNYLPESVWSLPEASPESPLAASAFAESWDESLDAAALH